MQNEKQVPIAVVKRLPRYFRYLGEMLRNNVERISSSDLSEKMNVTASQIRQDLNNFGGFGQQGYGYNVEHLYNEIGKILGVDKGFKTIIIGAGNLGHAIANYSNLQKRGFTLIGIFDVDKSKTGQKINDISVFHMSELEQFMNNEKPDIAILTLPKDEVTEVAETLGRLGIKGIWNFSYSDLKISYDIPIENVHLSDSLMTLSYRININTTF